MCCAGVRDESDNSMHIEYRMPSKHLDSKAKMKNWQQRWIEYSESEVTNVRFAKNMLCGTILFMKEVISAFDHTSLERAFALKLW